MSEQNTAQLTEAKEAPRLLADGDVYAVKVGPFFFGDLDEDGHPVLWRTPRAEALETAKERKELLAKIEYVYAEISIVKLTNDRSGEVTFWADHDADGRFSSCSVEIASPVRHGEMPDWFKAAMMAFNPADSQWEDFDREDYNIAWDVFVSNIPDGHGWLDHYGWSGEGEDSYFVSEPYHLHPQDVRNLTEVCQRFNFDFEISGRSNHYPSSTMRIMIRPLAKLPYVKRVRVVSEEVLAWEARRDAAALKMNLTLACDFIDHVLPLVNEDCKEDLTIRTNILRNIAEMERPSAELYLDDAKYRLDMAVEVGDFVCRDLHRSGMSSTPEIAIARAIASAAQLDKRDSSLGYVGFNCAEAVENDFCQKNNSWTEKSFYAAREAETKWQKEHSDPVIEAFWAEWKDS